MDGQADPRAQSAVASIAVEPFRRESGDAAARQIRYKIARALGIRDARMFHKRLGVEDPNMKLALGPVQGSDGFFVAALARD